MESVDVSIPVNPETAAASDDNPLLSTMRQMAAEAASLGLTQEIVEAELAAHKAERHR